MLWNNNSYSDPIYPRPLPGINIMLMHCLPADIHFCLWRRGGARDYAEPMTFDGMWQTVLKVCSCRHGVPWFSFDSEHSACLLLLHWWRGCPVYARQHQPMPCHVQRDIFRSIKGLWFPVSICLHDSEIRAWLCVSLRWTTNYFFQDWNCVIEV